MAWNAGINAAACYCRGTIVYPALRYQVRQIVPLQIWQPGIRSRYLSNLVRNPPRTLHPPPPHAWYSTRTPSPFSCMVFQQDTLFLILLGISPGTASPSSWMVFHQDSLSLNLRGIPAGNPLPHPAWYFTRNTLFLFLHGISPGTPSSSSCMVFH